MSEGVVVHLLGGGSAFPSTVISDEHLREVLAPSVADFNDYVNGSLSVKVRARRSSLPRDFISGRETQSVLHARSKAETSPTALALTAVEEALSKAGIAKEQIGLIIADTSTPFQTCPSEAQRIGGALGLKVPAYDVVGGSAAFLLHLDILNSWDENRLPEYCLLVSTNTPTLHVDYSSDAKSAYVYGDGAAAIVISPRVSGKLKLVSSYRDSSAHYAPVGTIDQLISFDEKQLPSSTAVSELVTAGLRAANQLRSTKEAAIFVIGTPFCNEVVSSTVKTSGDENIKVLDVVAENGFALGSSSMIALASAWNDLKKGDIVSVSQVGDRFFGRCELIVAG